MPCFGILLIGADTVTPSGSFAEVLVAAGSFDGGSNGSFFNVDNAFLTASTTLSPCNTADINLFVAAFLSGCS